jgi:hypothetical protein
MNVRRLASVLTGLLLLAALTATMPATATTRPIRAAGAVPSTPERVRWRLQLAADYSLHSPGIGPDGTIYVAMSNGRLYAVSAQGTTRWVFQAGLGGGIHGPVAVGADGSIYVAAMVPASTGSGNTGAIISLRPDGTQRWLFETGDFMIAGPNIGPDGNIYAVTDLLGIGLFSLTPSGLLRFHTGSFTEYGSLGEEIAFGPNRLYFNFDMFGVGPARLFAYDLSGNLVFEATGVSGGAQPATGPNGNVVTPTFPTGVGLSLGAFAPNGTRLWSYYEFPGNVQTAADVGPDNTAYSSRNLSTLLALDAAGQVRWRYVDPGILFEPAVTPSGSLVFVPGRVTYGEPGFFLGVSAAGQPLWRVDLPDEPGFEPYGQLVPMSRPVFSPDGGTAYVVTDVAGDGSTGEYSFLYAIDVTSGGGGGGVPAAPTSLVATGVSTSQVTLTWTDASSNESGFSIERCTGRRCTAFSVVGQVGPNVTSFSNTGLSARTQYRYRVRAFNSAGSSAYSNVAAVRTLR